MIKVLELFAGVGSQAQALANIGIDYQIIGISEIDKYAIQAYEILHGKVTNFGDICNINPNQLPDCDLITYTFPCQNLSIIGFQGGMDEGSGTKSSLLWECKKIIEIKKPKYLLMENVKNLISKTNKKNFDKWLQFLEELGYTNYWKVLNAADYNVPQNRERIFVISILDNKQIFNFPSTIGTYTFIKDILENEQNIPNKMYYNKPFIPIKNQNNNSNGLILAGYLDMIARDHMRRVYNVNGLAPTLMTVSGGNTEAKILTEKGPRKMTPKEYWRCMGFSEEQFNKVKDKFSNTQLYKMAGNAICVPILEAIFKEMFK